MYNNYLLARYVSLCVCHPPDISHVSSICIARCYYIGKIKYCIIFTFYFNIGSVNMYLNIVLGINKCPDKFNIKILSYSPVWYIYSSLIIDIDTHRYIQCFIVMSSDNYM